MVDLGRIQIGTTSTSPKSLNKRDFPSITGSASIGPMFPYPKTEVPSDTIAINVDVLE